MRITVKEIINVLHELNVQYNISGNMEIEVSSYSPLNTAMPNTVTWVKEWRPEIYERIESIESLVIICNNAENKYDSQTNCLISCENPKMTFFEILNHFFVNEEKQTEISERAVVETENIGRNCSVGPFTHIGPQVEIGDDVSIAANVTIEGKVRIGDRCSIGPGCRIGEPSFGFYKDSSGHQKRVPQLGGVVIGDDVEIRANTLVDRGTMGDTVIGSHTKIDGLCIIAHNDQVGEDVAIIGCTSLGGSCVISSGSYIGPNASIMNQRKLGENSFVGMHTCVIRDVKDNESVYGVPARPFRREYKV